MNKYINNKRGATLPFVLAIFLVLFILGMAILQLSMAETRNTTWQNNRVQAHYLGRSGVTVGSQAVIDYLNSNNFTGSLSQLVNHMNSTFAQPSYTVSGTGSYTVDFSLTPLNELKISSKGTTDLAKPDGSNVVSMTKELTFGLSSLGFEDAAEWFHTNGFSLAPGVFPHTASDPYNKSYLGKAARIAYNRRTMLNPSVGSPANASIFRASILSLGSYRDNHNRNVSLEANPNSYGKFDAEIIYFMGDLLIGNNNAEVTLQVSEAVLRQKYSDPSIHNPLYPNPHSPKWSLDILNYDSPATTPPAVPEIVPVGFESNNRYKALTGADRTGSWPFVTGVNYGIVRIPRIGATSGSTTYLSPNSGYQKGYYYFPHNVRLWVSSGSLSRASLIPIPDNDPITNVIDEFFKWNWGSGTELWDNH